jgi:hypothetical protein
LLNDVFVVAKSYEVIAMDNPVNKEDALDKLRVQFNMKMTEVTRNACSEVKKTKDEIDAEKRKLDTALKSKLRSIEDAMENAKAIVVAWMADEEKRIEAVFAKPEEKK